MACASKQLGSEDDNVAATAAAAACCIGLLSLPQASPWPMLSRTTAGPASSLPCWRPVALPWPCWPWWPTPPATSRGRRQRPRQPRRFSGAAGRQQSGRCCCTGSSTHRAEEAAAWWRAGGLGASDSSGGDAGDAVGRSSRGAGGGSDSNCRMWVGWGRVVLGFVTRIQQWHCSLFLLRPLHQSKECRPCAQVA